MRRLLPLAIILLLPPAHVHACQCGGWPTAPEARHAAAAVFEGVVVQKSPVLASYEGYWFVVERWTFTVDRSWKGSDTRVVVTQGYSNCSKIYSLGQKALVYAYRHESRRGELETHKCGEPRGDWAEQVKALGPPLHGFASPEPQPEPRVRRSVRHLQVYALTALSVAHNAVVAARERPSSPTGIAVIASGLLVFIQLLALVTIHRHRAKIASVLVVTILVVLSSSFFIASRQLKGGYFSHLIEYECPACPGG